MLELSENEFETIVGEELDALSEEIVEGLDNVIFVIEARLGDSATEDSLDVLGLYEGVSLTERDNYGFGEMPDRIIIFRDALLNACDSLEQLRHEIHVTLVHEISHFYGIDDERLHELGWG